MLLFFLLVSRLAALLMQTDGGAGIATKDLWLAVLAILTVVATALLAALPVAWNQWLKRLICAVVSLLLALGGTYYAGTLDMNDIGRTWLVIFMAATTIYVVLWKPVVTAIKAE